MCRVPLPFLISYACTWQVWATPLQRTVNSAQSTSAFSTGWPECKSLSADICEHCNFADIKNHEWKIQSCCMKPWTQTKQNSVTKPNTSELTWITCNPEMRSQTLWSYIWFVRRACVAWGRCVRDSIISANTLSSADCIVLLSCAGWALLSRGQGGALLRPCICHDVCICQDSFVTLHACIPAHERAHAFLLMHS